jgi:ribosome biogenesis GTPase
MISAKYKTNLENLISYLSKQTSIFVGNSGAGKSTLTSSLTGKEILSKSLSNNQGVHTTSISTLYETVNMMKVIDSPGIRDIDINYLTNDQILKGFKEIYYLSLKCSFSNCGHNDDKGCAVIDGLKNDEIQQSRYNNFMALKKRIN